MAEAKAGAIPKSRIESLSDLIFGLALSIGALTLIERSPSNFQQLLLNLAFYAFSFLILIRVWHSYTSTMSDIHFETPTALYFNIILLFLVSIEPYLFNELVTTSLSPQNVSLIYALDLGGLFLILGLFDSAVSADTKQPENLRRHYRILRNTLLIGAAVFFISALPFFWTLAIPLNSSHALNLRFVFWIFALILSLIRRTYERVV